MSPASSGLALNPCEYAELALRADPWEIEDARLRAAAPRLYEPTSDVVSIETGHPSMVLTCEECGHQPVVLLWCGVGLCMPCQRKQGARTFHQVARVLSTYRKLRETGGLRPGIRLVTLTIPSSRSLLLSVRLLFRAWVKLRTSKFWGDRVEGDLLKFEVTWNPTAGFHAHLHVLAGGSFIPSHPEHARIGEPDLQTEWSRILGTSGAVVDVREAATDGDDLTLARELSKYLVKPFVSESESQDGARLALSAWPESVRADLAALKRGGDRTRWYCYSHRTSSRRACEALDSDRWPCERAGYRREATGFRGVRWYGAFACLRKPRHTHGRKNPVECEWSAPEETICPAREADAHERDCPKCRSGRLLGPREVRVRLRHGWVLPPGAVGPELPRSRSYGRTTSEASRAPGAGGERGEGAGGVRTLDSTYGSGPPDRPVAEEWGAAPW